MGICESKTNQNKDANEPKPNLGLNKVNEQVPGNIDQNETKEMLVGYNIPLSVEVVSKAIKSICKITIKKNPENIYGTGFFMKISDNQEYLLTNYHIVSQDNINDDIEIEIYNHKKMKLNLNNRNIKYYPYPKDITMIEIKNYDSIYNEIKFLKYDLSYKTGYDIYKDAIIFSIHHANGESAQCAGGKIRNIDGFEFDHSIPTENGSSGCPIILLSKNINSILVIGIHKEANTLKKLNTGTFIGEIFNNEIKLYYC